MVRSDNPETGAAAARISSGSKHHLDSTGMVAAIVQRANDRAALSDDLHLAAVSSFERQHLSRSRANVLRSLNIPSNAVVLELGCECGALTRYLGEQVAAVDAFERDPYRASVASARTAGLPGVTIHNGTPNRTDRRRTYDIAVVSGEHSRAPDSTLLRSVRNALRPGGVLCMIGANNISIDRLVGDSGEHVTGAPRKVWERAITDAGFAIPTVLGCLPDHRETQLVFRDELIAEEPQLLERLSALPTDTRRLWDELVAADVAAAAAGSFLLLAVNNHSDAVTDEHNGLQLWPDAHLAVSFSTERAAVWCKSARVVRTSSGVQIEHVPMCGTGSSRDGVSIRTWSEPALSAPTMARTLLTQPWRCPELLDRWFDTVLKRSSEQPHGLWCIIPHNVIVPDDPDDPDDDAFQGYAVTNLEWDLAGIGVDAVVDRGLLLLADYLATEGWDGAAADNTVGDLARWLGAVLRRPPDFVEAAIEREAWFEAHRTYGSSSWPDFERQCDRLRGQWRGRLLDPVQTPAPASGQRAHGLGLDHAVAAAMSKVDRVIADGDTMFRGSTRHYFAAAGDALRACLHGLNAVGRPRPDRVLDFGCGYGRVLRALRAAFPEARLICCDVDPAGVEYCRERFDAEPLAGSTEIAAVEMVEQVDLIWAGSVLTHVSAYEWAALLRYIARALAPGGVAVVTVHGRRVAHRMKQPHSHGYGLSSSARTQVLADYNATGFGYQDYPGQRGYGISLCTIGWINGLLASTPELRLAGYTESGWDNHQDTVVLAKDADYTVRGLG